MKKLWLALGLIAFLSGLIVITLIANPRGPREPEYQGRTLTRWLDFFNDPSSPMQANARLAIRQMGTNAVPFLVHMLYAKDSPFKRKYIALLKRQHWMDFHVNYDFDVRVRALQGLMILGPDAKAAIPDLANLVMKDDEFRDGTVAVFTLVQIGPSAVPAIEMGLTNSSEHVRYQAVDALGAVADPSCVTNILLVLKDPDWMTRSGAAMALRRFPKQSNVIVPALINCLDDPNDVFRGSVMRTLGSFGPDAMPAFPKLLQIAASTNEGISGAAANALIDIDFDETLAAFTNNLESTDVNVRRTTSRALIYFRSEGGPAVPSLVKCLRDPDAQVRENAAIALGDIPADPDLVVPALIANLNDPDPEIRVVSAISLRSFGARAESAVPQILKIIDENREDADGNLERLYNALNDIDPQAAAVERKIMSRPIGRPARPLPPPPPP